MAVPAGSHPLRHGQVAGKTIDDQRGDAGLNKRADIIHEILCDIVPVFIDPFQRNFLFNVGDLMNIGYIRDADVRFLRSTF